MQNDVRKDPKKHRSKWDPVSVNEMKTYTGSCIAMGTLKLTFSYDYWQQKPFLVVHSFGKTLSPDQYKQSHYHLNSCHEEGSAPKYKPGHDPLYKIRGLMNLVIPKFEFLYVPNQNICIEKIIILLKGNLKVYSIRADSIWYQSMGTLRVKIRICVWFFFEYS